MNRADAWATYEALSVFQEPLCLIENGPDGELKECVEVLDQLKQIKCQLNVIAITGPYRSGKSYLLNYLAGKRQGFPLGSTIQATTKGIWVWCRPHPERYNEVLLLLDTEGLGDPTKEKIGQKYEEIYSEWERDHRESKCQNGGQEMKNKRLHDESESLQRQCASILKDKLIEEKENSIKEKERRLRQRNNEYKILRDKDTVLLEQQNKMMLDIKQEKTELQEISEGGSSFVKFLRVIGSTLIGALTGAAGASTIGLGTANPFIVAFVTVAGALAGGFKGLADGLIGKK